MQFTSRSEAEAFFRSLGIGANGLLSGSRTATRFKSVDLFYQSRLTTAREVASALAQAQGEFSTCMVWPFALAWGDRSTEEDAPRDWIEYRCWREIHSETRALYDAPGHLFQSNESADLARLMELAIHMGWDAIVGARPNKILVELSHNDRITIHGRSWPSTLISELERLGLNSAKGQ